MATPNAVEMQPQGVPRQVTVSTCDINWGDHNFPQWLRLAHFDLDEIQGAPKRFTVRLYSTFIAIRVILMLNCMFVSSHTLVLSTIIQAAADYRGSIALLYTILSIIDLAIRWGRFLRVPAIRRVCDVQGVPRGLCAANPARRNKVVQTLPGGRFGPLVHLQHH